MTPVDPRVYLALAVSHVESGELVGDVMKANTVRLGMVRTAYDSKSLFRRNPNARLSVATP
jgi:hypothetical protein